MHVQKDPIAKLKECARARAALVLCYEILCFWSPNRIFRSRLFLGTINIAAHPDLKCYSTLALLCERLKPVRKCCGVPK